MSILPPPCVSCFSSGRAPSAPPILPAAALLSVFLSTPHSLDESFFLLALSALRPFHLSASHYVLSSVPGCLRLSAPHCPLALGAQPLLFRFSSRAPRPPASAFTMLIALARFFPSGCRYANGVLVARYIPGYFSVRPLVPCLALINAQPLPYTPRRLLAIGFLRASCSSPALDRYCRSRLFWPVRFC